jgi:hypothetical protein
VATLALLIAFAAFAPDQGLVTRYNEPEGVAVAGQAGGHKFGVVLDRCGHGSGVHHTTAYVARAGGKVTEKN